MGQSLDQDLSYADLSLPSYSPQLRRSLNVGAIAVALLPIPVNLLQLVPAYAIHSRFLIFYTPFICLLTLAYSVYVRDALARMMFGHLLNPVPIADYYPEPRRLKLRRLLAWARRCLLAVLPGLLLLGSFACVMWYTDRLERSAAEVSAVLSSRPAAPEEVGLIGRPDNTQGFNDAAGGLLRGPRLEPDREVTRSEALRVATIDDIPNFLELTMLYLGAFLAAMLALILMAIREYAKEALGLSERDIVLGRILLEPE